MNTILTSKNNKNYLNFNNPKTRNLKLKFKQCKFKIQNYFKPYKV